MITVQSVCKNLILAKTKVGLNELVCICQKIIFMKELEGNGSVNLKIEDIKILIN